MNEMNQMIWYGGDYNPDQWSKEIIDLDFEYFKKAHMTVLTLPVFSWAKLEPTEGTYNFKWLDEIFDKAIANNMKICLATSTAVQPAWMSRKYPDMLPVDFEGRQRKIGGRVKFCPTNLNYRKASVALAKAMAKRYGKNQALLVWHIGNEYDNYCYCDHCAKEFRLWAKKTYKTLDHLNERWYLDFWGHRIYDWDEIEVPNGLSEMWQDQGKEKSTFQSISLDYKRFMNEVILECYLGEHSMIKNYTPDVPVTTNLMGAFKPLDYFKWAKHMDIISWDHYPSLKDKPYQMAMRNDLMRSLKQGQSFMLMEQTPSQQNWAPYNALKRPGMMRLQSYQTLAHGGDTIMFFQMRRSRGNCEKYHGALIAHAGHTETRVFRECQTFGKELKRLGSAFTESRMKASVGIMFDWDNWWALELSSGPSIDIDYIEQIEKYYKACHDLNIGVDFVESCSDLSQYDVVIAPMLYMVKKGQKEVIERFVNNGGTFVTTTMTGYVDENDQVDIGGYPGQLKEILGIWVEEIDGLFPDMSNKIVLKNKPSSMKKASYNCHMLCDIIHANEAEVLGTYGKDFYEGTPVVTVNSVGKGKAYYIGTVAEDAFVGDLLGTIFEDKDIKGPLKVSENIEVTLRFNQTQKFYFVINHNDISGTIELEEPMQDLITGEIVKEAVKIQSKDVMILTKIK